MSRIALRHPAPPVVAAALVAGLAGLTCVYPGDRSGEVYVSVTSSDSLLFRDSLLLQGTQATLVAQAWQRLAGGDSAALQNIEFRWVSSNPTFATVQGQGGGTARLTGVASGHDTIRVAAMAFQDGKPASFPLRVSTPFKIDSVRADTAGYSPVATFNGDPTHRSVKYGQFLTFYGVGIRGIFFATVGGVLLVADTFSFKGVREGVGQMAFWVPFPAQSGKPVALAFGGNAFDTTSIHVIRHDIYKETLPNDTLPRKLNIDGPGPIPQLPSLIVFDPALAFEDLPKGDTVGADWYRFTRSDTTSSITLILTTPQSGNLTSTVLSDSIVYQSSTKTYTIGPSAWTIGPREYDCHGRPFLPAESPPDSLIVALKGPLPSKVLHLLSRYRNPGSYGLAIVSGYLTADPRIAPDRFEGNNTCTLADANFTDPTKPWAHLVLSGSSSFRDSTLTIDNPHDIDWYRFDVTGLAQTVTIQSAAFPFDATVPDTSDIDLYVLTHDTLGVVGKATTVSSSEALTLPALAPGSYYLVVVDFAGIPTRYSLCMVDGLACTPPAASSPAAVATNATVRPGGVRTRRAPRPSAAPRVPWRR